MNAEGCTNTKDFFYCYRALQLSKINGCHTAWLYTAWLAFRAKGGAYGAATVAGWTKAEAVI
jgi:hypothetical protein